MKKEKTFLYTIARGIAAIIYRGFFGAKARGMENYPQDENCIILGNHFSAWDPITIARYYTISEVHFLSKASLFRNPLLSWLLRTLHAIPVRRGETDMAAMRSAMQVIRDGHVLGIFPEGTRQAGDKVRQIETGVAVMALKSEAPLVPVLVTGKYRFRGRLRLVVGKPIDIEDLRALRPDAPTMETLKARIIDAIEALRPLAEF